MRRYVIRRIRKGEEQFYSGSSYATGIGSRDCWTDNPFSSMSWDSWLEAERKRSGSKLGGRVVCLGDTSEIIPEP